MTRFLMFKIAIRCKDIELASECLEKVSTVSTKDANLLYACVLDAQQVGNREQALRALQLVLEKHDYSAPNTIHLPSLLRVTIGLMVSQFDNIESKSNSEHSEGYEEKLCKLFEAGKLTRNIFTAYSSFLLAVSAIKKAKLQPPGAEIIWTVSELEWFSKNSYNLGIKNLAHWDARHSARILTSCVSFIDYYPGDISSQVSDDLVLRRMFCEFTIATAFISLARSEDLIETQLQDYLGVRQHVKEFDKMLHERLAKLEDGPAQDLLTKLGVLLAYEFEAACRLKAWDDLREIILKAETCKTMRVYEIMADCILSCEAPTTGNLLFFSSLLFSLHSHPSFLFNVLEA